MNFSLPAYVAVPRFPRGDEVCVYDGPRAWIAFAEKNHAGLRFQGSVEPRQRVGGVSP